MDLHRQSLASLARLSNTELIARVKHLAQREREATAALIALLAELDQRRLYLAEGCSSLFKYCTQVLHLSEHAAFGRIEAARAARRFPIILNRLADGAVTLTTIRLLAPHLTPENHQDLLDKTRHQSRRAVEEVVAQLRPLPPIPSMVRRLPGPRPHPSSPSIPHDEQGTHTPPVEIQVGTQGKGLVSDVRAAAAVRGPWQTATITPLSPQLYKIQCTVSSETKEKLRRAQALLRHQVPDGDLAAIIDRALAALLEQVAKEKVAATDRPRRTSGQDSLSTSRHIPNAVKREVWIRDGGRCVFVSKSGRRCSEDGFLEFHHVKPYAAGGKASPNNIQLRCRAHNSYEAEQYFGARTAAGVREEQASYPSASYRTLSGGVPDDKLLAPYSNSVRTELPT